MEPTQTPNPPVTDTPPAPTPAPAPDPATATPPASAQPPTNPAAGAMAPAKPKNNKMKIWVVLGVVVLAAILYFLFLK
jgi:type VI protein secretion system component VasF